MKNFNINKLDKYVNILKGYGYILFKDELILKSKATNKLFSINNNLKNKIYYIFIKIIHSILEEYYLLKKVEYVIDFNTFRDLNNSNIFSLQNNILNEKDYKNFIFSSYNYVKNSKVLVIISDIDVPIGIINKSALYYHGIYNGSVLNIINTAYSKNFCTVIINPNNNKINIKKLNNIINDNNNKNLYENNLRNNKFYYNHIKYMFKEFIVKNNKCIKELIVLGFGLAGISILKLIDEDIFDESLRKSTTKIILINSELNNFYSILKSNIKKMEFWENKVVNYVPSAKSLGDVVCEIKESNW